MIDRRPLGNVIVATDLSAGARRAVERACRLPITPGSALTVLHVVPTLQPSPARAEEAIRRALEALAEEARAQVGADVDVVVAVEAGEPFVEINRRAEAERAELIVLGRHGERAWPRGLLGGTAERVLRRGRTPVLLVAADAAGPYRKPLVAVDEEGSATRAIELVARIAPDARGALAIHVVDSTRAGLRAPHGLPTREIELALDDLGGTELDFDLRVVEGDPRSAITGMAVAEQADLIAVGAHGRSGVPHLILGSVAEAVIRGAEVDVLAARAS